MRERGRYQIQCMKNRSGSGVGQKVDLEYSMDTMRITDPGLEAQEHHNGPPRTSNILTQIKTSTTVNPRPREETADMPIPPSSLESNKLKQMLAGLKSRND
jgi:hypothetical protein